MTVTVQLLAYADAMLGSLAQPKDTFATEHLGFIVWPLGAHHGACSEQKHGGQEASLSGRQATALRSMKCTIRAQPLFAYFVAAKTPQGATRTIMARQCCRFCTVVPPSR